MFCKSLVRFNVVNKSWNFYRTGSAFRSKHVRVNELRCWVVVIIVVSFYYIVIVFLVPNVDIASCLVAAAPSVRSPGDARSAVVVVADPFSARSAVDTADAASAAHRSRVERHFPTCRRRRRTFVRLCVRPSVGRRSSFHYPEFLVCRRRCSCRSTQTPQMKRYLKIFRFH